MAPSNAPLWNPGVDRAAASAMAAFRSHAEVVTGLSFPDYAALHHWSVTKPEQFWGRLAGFLRLRWQEEPKRTWSPPPVGRMRGAQWFPEGRLNFAENLLEPSSLTEQLDSAECVVSYYESAQGTIRESLTRRDLRRRVSARIATLRTYGVTKGDRVAGVIINGPEALITMLATAALGAIWSSCSPDFGLEAIVDRLAQIRPKVVFVSKAYYYNGKHIDCSATVQGLTERMPGKPFIVTVDHLNRRVDSPQGDDPFLDDTPIKYELCSFGDPQYIMFSSGTTGVPKCIVHSVGGTLLQHMKELVLHCDMGPQSSLLFFTTCGWMMWNWMVSALAVGTRLILFDGSPTSPSVAKLWEVVAAEKVTHFGTSPRYLAATAAAGYRPGVQLDLTALRCLLSTGSPLLPEQFDWVYGSVKSDLHLASISGGTDIISCFVLGNPEMPVYRGEIQVPGLGMAVDVWAAHGSQGQIGPVRGERGELVCVRPFVSMPTAFWNDEQNRKYSAAYFDFFSAEQLATIGSHQRTGLSVRDCREIWRHGDFVEWSEFGGMVVYGRSDATLNPGGVRIGTAELYRQVETLRGIQDSIAVGQQFDGDTRIILFVKLMPGNTFSDEFATKIKKQIRQTLSPRHVPAVILPVKDIPYTRSGKKMELAVTQVIHGEPLLNSAAIANPECIGEYETLREALTT